MIRSKYDFDMRFSAVLEPFTAIVYCIIVLVIDDKSRTIRNVQGMIQGLRYSKNITIVLHCAFFDDPLTVLELVADGAIDLVSLPLDLADFKYFGSQLAHS